MTDTLGLKLVQTSEYMKPYSGNPDYVDVQGDAALVEGIAEQHGRAPALISTKKALGRYDDDGVLDEVGIDDDRREHYGNLKGSNQFAIERLAAVVGSKHYGDDYIKRWSAYAGEAAERGDERGVELSYGEFGDEVYQHMTHNETLQAAMRFGRDGGGANRCTSTRPRSPTGSRSPARGASSEPAPTVCARSSTRSATWRAAGPPTWSATMLSRSASGRCATTSPTSSSGGGRRR